MDSWCHLGVDMKVVGEKILTTWRGKKWWVWNRQRSKAKIIICGTDIRAVLECENWHWTFVSMQDARSCTKFHQHIWHWLCMDMLSEDHYGLCGLELFANPWMFWAVPAWSARHWGIVIPLCQADVSTADLGSPICRNTCCWQCTHMYAYKRTRARRTVHALVHVYIYLDNCIYIYRYVYIYIII